MARISAMAVLAALVLAAIPGGTCDAVQDEPAADPTRLVPEPGVPEPTPAAPPGKKAVVVPGYEPRPGERAALVSAGGKVLVVKARYEVDSLVKLGATGDNAGLNEIVKARRAALVAPGTAVLVLGASTFSDGRDVHITYEVRLLDGPYRGQAAYCLEENVGRLTYVPKSRADLRAEREAAKKPAPAPPPADEQRAEGLLKAAENLEK